MRPASLGGIMREWVIGQYLLSWEALEEGGQRDGRGRGSFRWAADQLQRLRTGRAGAAVPAGVGLRSHPGRPDGPALGRAPARGCARLARAWPLGELVRRLRV